MCCFGINSSTLTTAEVRSKRVPRRLIGKEICPLRLGADVRTHAAIFGGGGGLTETLAGMRARTRGRHAGWLRALMAGCESGGSGVSVRGRALWCVLSGSEMRCNKREGEQPLDNRRGRVSEPGVRRIEGDELATSVWELGDFGRLRDKASGCSRCGGRACPTAHSPPPPHLLG